MPAPQTPRPFNLKFVTRGFILVLLLIIIGLLSVSLSPSLLVALIATLRSLPPPDPTPLPPTITAPRGPLPAGPVGLTEWRHNRDGQTERVGSGFLLRLPNATVVAVTTAHSVSDLGQPGSPLVSLAFNLSGQSDFLLDCDQLYGLPGRPRLEADLSIDYVFLAVPDPAALDPDLILIPDPRALPQPGERVLLFSGLGDGQGGPRPLAGTIQSAGPTAVWALMDETFEPGQMSGSPLLSQHTGQVVGLTIAATPRRRRLLMGFHPIGALLQHAAAVTMTLPIDTYQR